jgi:hypothetical protein
MNMPAQTFIELAGTTDYLKDNGRRRFMLEKEEHAEWQLATALGWKNLFNAGGTLVGTPPDGGPRSRGQAAVPRWARDDAASFDLMVQHDRWPVYSNVLGAEVVYVVSTTSTDRGVPPVRIAAFSSKKTAVRMAVIASVTAAFMRSPPMSEVNVLRQLVDALTKHQRPVIPFSIDLWDTSTIAAYLKRSDDQVRERVTCLPDFPKQYVCLPTADSGRRGRPLYEAAEVVAWVEKYRESKTVVDR